MTFHRIKVILNSEGPILKLLKNSFGSLFICGRTDKGKSTIICQVNRFRLELYLRSRIPLKQLFALAQSSHYFIIRDGQAEAAFFEIESEDEPPELKNIQCGEKLYDLLPSGMKCGLSVNEILRKLPEVKDGIIMSVIENFETRPSSVQFFSEESLFQLVQIVSEVHNPFEFDFLKVKLKTDNSYLLCKVNPNLLKLLFMNQITLQEYFKAQSHYEYFYFSGKEWYKFFYSTAIEGMIQNIQYGNLTYYSLPKEWQAESVMGLWDYYTKNIVLSGGYGIQPADFQTEYPINVELK